MNILILLEKKVSRKQQFSNKKLDIKIKCVHVRNNQTKAIDLNPVDELPMIS